MATIGLRDVHYAILQSDTPTGATYDTPERLVGAISANVNPNTSSATLFADDGPYDSASTLGEIELELNMADIPAAASNKLLGHTYKNGVLIKKASDQPPYVAVGYRSLKSNGAYRYTWLLKGKFADGEQSNQTKGDSIEYSTPTITGAFVKRDYDDAWQVEADSDDATINPETIANWFTAVVDPEDIEPGPKPSLGTLTVNSAAGTSAGKTKVTVTPAKEGSNSYMYKTGSSLTNPAYDEVCNTGAGYTAWNGTDEITATTGQKILVVEVETSSFKARKAGQATITSMA